MYHTSAAASATFSAIDAGVFHRVILRHLQIVTNRHPPIGVQIDSSWHWSGPGAGAGIGTVGRGTVGTGNGAGAGVRLRPLPSGIRPSGYRSIRHGRAFARCR